MIHIKGIKDLSFNPTNRSRSIEQLIKYKANGEIYSTDINLNKELEIVLNLNVRELKENRRLIYEEIRDKIRNEGKKFEKKAISKQF